MISKNRKIQLSGLHPSVGEIQVDHVVTGAIAHFNDSPSPKRSLLPFEDEAATDANNSNETIPVIIEDDRECLRQWHAGACGYNALFNAKQGLYGEPVDNVSFWKFVFACFERLNKRKEECGLWPNYNVEIGTIDENHMQYLIETDPELKNQCFIVESTQQLETLLTTEPKSNAKNSRRAFLLACSSHWICGIEYGFRRFSIADSHHKPLCSVRSCADSLALAERVVESYRSQFREKMKHVSRYKHYPDEVLNRIYDEGVPEYWKGVEKDNMWWSHRPYRVRVSILYREIEKSRSFIEIIRDVRGSAVQPPDTDPNTTALDVVIVPAMRLLPRSDGVNVNNVDMIVGASTARFRQAINPGVYTNLTFEEPFLRSFVRRDEALNIDDDAYDPNAPPTVMNRKRPPPNEIKGDVFDRQRVIAGFDQGAIERQICLVVGTGGIGMNVALTLARLGVDEIIMIDYDVYDASNLTRQCLGTRSDVGLKKTAIAARNVQAHNLRSKISTVEADVVHDWQALVTVAKRCSVVFNCCDAGLMVDFALNSLSKELSIPLVSGQSFGWKFMSEFYTGHCDNVCQFCTEGTMATFAATNVKACEALYSRYLDAPNVGVASIQRLDALFSTNEQFRLLPNAFAMFASRHPKLAQACAVASFTLEDFHYMLSVFHEHATQSLLPGQVSLLADLCFVPRPKPPPTRYVGSWICPCMGCSVMCVSHWSSFLTAPGKRNPPSTILFNMDEGMTAEEQMAYDCQMPLDRMDRSFAKSPSRESCRVCNEAARLKSIRDVWWGSLRVFLRPVAGGDALPNPGWSVAFDDEEREKRIKSLEYRREFNNRGKMLLPLVPAVDPAYRGAVGSQYAEYDRETLMWPGVDISHLPMVKSNEDDAAEWPGSMEGIASGIRSAIVFGKCNRVYRLKGCGNLEQAFPVEVKGDDGVSVSLRGCMFETTCARELFMTDYIQTECGIVCGNRAVGFYHYPRKMPRTINTQWKWEAESVDRFCGVFQTLGEKRLGDDLLRGLERLLAERFPQGVVGFKDLYVSFCNDSARAAFVDRMEDVWDTATLVESGGDPINILSEVNTSFANSQERQVRDFLQLAWRLGRESGAVMRIFAEKGISWGTFPDEMGIHCNAHANNFVVVVPSPSDSCITQHLFLAPLDFDMAFTRETFVPGMWTGKDSFFPKEFDGILSFEQTMGMRTSLAGSDFTSTGVDNTGAGEGSPHLRLLRIAFRDCLVAGYDAALKNVPDAYPDEQVEGFNVSSKALVFEALGAAAAVAAASMQ